MLFLVFMVAWVVQCGYALWFFMRSQGDEPDATGPTEKKRGGERYPVSVIICARNEAANLRKNLPMVLSQVYEAGYEVVVVNDASTDDTAHVLARLAGQYDKLRVVHVGADEVRTLQGKKHALGKGVHAARHEWLVMTDADCVPAGSGWLGPMAAPLAENRARRAGSVAEIVLGYGGYNKTKGLLNAFIRWETLHTWVQYSGYALAGRPYMAVGRNMACARSVWLQAQTHELWNVLPGGDDDMLVRIAGRADNVAVVGEAAAHTYSDAKATWGEWAQQKQRHLSTGKYYSRGIKWLLGTYAITHGQVWGAAALMCMVHLGWLPGHADGAYWPWVLPLLAVRCLLYWGIWAAAAVRLRQKNLILMLPLMDIGWLLYNFAFAPWIAWKNKRQWT